MEDTEVGSSHGLENHSNGDEPLIVRELLILINKRKGVRMNYQKIYNQIIEKRKLEEPIGYVEIHHIIPRSLGGSDDKDNLVKLTAREHFICHYLLAKVYDKESLEWYKMNNAFIMMQIISTKHTRYLNSRLYSSLKKNHSHLMSFMQTGKGNSQYGTMWICNVELQENRKINKDDVIPDGWVKGRNVWKNNKQSADYYYKLYIDSGISLTKFVAKNKIKYSLPSVSTLSILFSKHILEWKIALNGE